MKRVFITGFSGFIGQSLRKYLTSKGALVFGFDRRANEEERVFGGDLTDPQSLLRALEKAQPDIIFHLAGILKAPEMATFYNVHVLGTATLFDAILEIGLKPRILIASSGAVYGKGAGAKPIAETFSPRPLTHYAVSKLAQEQVALRYRHAYQLPVMIARTFNLLGAGLSPQLAPSAFAKQIAQAEIKHKPKVIHTGDLSALRDYVDVRDAVRAYDMIARRGTPGQIYNVCSGKAVSMEECLRILSSRARVEIERVFDPQRRQNHDVPIQVGDPQKMERELGWRAQIPIERSLLDLLNDWRKKIKQEERE